MTKKAEKVKAEKVTKAKDVEAVTLRAIDRELREIGDLIEEAHGELPPEVEARLDALHGERDQKIEAIAIVRRTMNRNEETCQLDADYYSSRAEMWKRASERLKKYVHEVLRFGAEPVVRVRTAKVHVYRQRNSRPSFLCERPDLLPDDLRRDYQKPASELLDSVALERWREEFDRLLSERTALMTKEERDLWVLEHLQALADEACTLALPAGVRCVMEEHLKMP